MLYYTIICYNILQYANIFRFPESRNPMYIVSEAPGCIIPYVYNVLEPPDAQNTTYKVFWSLHMPKTLQKYVFWRIWVSRTHIRKIFLKLEKFF